VRATAPGGRRIRMTATPDHELLRQAEAGESALIRVPARYHGYPLPVPELVEDRTLGDALAGDGAEGRRPFRPSRRLLSLVERSLAAGPAQARVLVFVPTVALAEWVAGGWPGTCPTRSFGPTPATPNATKSWPRFCGARRGCLSPPASSSGA